MNGTQGNKRIRTKARTSHLRRRHCMSVLLGDKQAQRIQAQALDAEIVEQGDHQAVVEHRALGAWCGTRGASYTHFPHNTNRLPKEVRK